MHSGTIIHMSNVPGDWKLRQLDQPLKAVKYGGGVELIPAGFVWNGSSSGVLAPVFPRHRHPIASCRHDWRCRNAKTKEERAWADREFAKDVGKTSWWVTKQIGYIGARIGVSLGVGCRYK